MVGRWREYRRKHPTKSLRAGGDAHTAKMYDDDDKYDLSAKNKSEELSDYDRAMLVQSSADEPAGPSSEPSWAAKYKAAEADKKKRKPTRLTGTVIKWNKGFGFIKVPGQADLYVHQRNVERQGAHAPASIRSTPDPSSLTHHCRQASDHCSRASPLSSSWQRWQTGSWKPSM